MSSDDDKNSKGASEGALYAMPRNLVLAASAGTGKTHALVGVVVHLLLGARSSATAPVDPSRIVATTFSRKAAAEIRTRVATEVERLALAPSTSVYIASVRAATANTTDRRLSDADISKRAKKALARLPQARFGTLHSFATGIVQRYAVELGLGPGFELSTESDARARADDAIARALEKRLESEPNALRALAEAAGGIDRLVYAFRRVLNQLEEDGRSARDLEVDMSDARVIDLEMNELVGHAGTIRAHPRCFIEAHALLAAWKAGDEQKIEDAAAALTGLAARGNKPREVEAFFAFRNGLPGTPNEEKGRRLARSWRSRDSFARYARLVRDIVAEAEVDIERTGRARAMLGFGEILRAARELLRDRPDVAEEVGAGIEALLVDEFQDTSRVQRDLLQLLWAEPGTRSRRTTGIIPPLSTMRRTGLLVVGDRKQSIYGFRGADVGVFAELAVGLAGAPAREALGIPVGVTWEPKEPLADFHALRHNRRSVPSILAFANAFSTRRFKVGDPPPELFEIEYVPLTEDLLSPGEPTDVPKPDENEIISALLTVRPSSIPTPGAPIPNTTWLRVKPKGGSSTRLEEALVISEKIQTILRTKEPRLRDKAVATAPGKDRDPSLRDIAVLATTNGMLDAVAFALAQANVPYVVAGKSFFRAREISDLAAMLSIVLDPSSRLALLEVLRGPWAGVHDETLLGLVEPGKGIVGPASWGKPPNPDLIRPEDRPTLDSLSTLILDLGRCAGRLGAGALLREAVLATGYELVLAAMPRGDQRVANVQKLLAMADRYPDARAFRSWLSDAKEQEIAESEAAAFSDADDAVRLLTVHASKGLDFPIVFIPEIGASLPRTDKGVARIAIGAGENANVLSVRITDDLGFVLEPPSYQRAYENTKRRERAERQRLAYVAVTRAADAMFLVGGRSRDTLLDPGVSTLGVLEMLSRDLLIVEDMDVPAARSPNEEEAPKAEEPPKEAAASIATPTKPTEPKWRTLPIAPTALADFDHCHRRFELVHLLGLPEHVRFEKQTEAEPASLTGETAAVDAASSAASPKLDARTRGTIAHAVLERLPLDAFLSPDVSAEPVVAKLLAILGAPFDHPQHASIARRVMRFLRTRYVDSLAQAGATLAREVSFVLGIDAMDGGREKNDRVVALRGSMDLVVTWPNGAIDVIDYKTARRTNKDVSTDAADLASSALQLDVYALAARVRFPDAKKIRVGLAFLGGGDRSGNGEPLWREAAPPNEGDDATRQRVAKLGVDLMHARFTETFPRTTIDRCRAIHCGFIGRCHPDHEPKPEPHEPDPESFVLEGGYALEDEFYVDYVGNDDEA